MIRINKPIRTFSWMSSKAVVDRSGKKGLGVYAKRSIKKNEIVAVTGGYIMTRPEIKKLPRELENLTYQVEDNLFIGVKQKAEVEDNWMFNHSCEPNLGQRGQLSLVAMRQIKSGEELTFDYATASYRIKGASQFKMRCLCGAKNCRKVITDEDWKIPALQKKYKGYFQLFLEEKINQLRKK